MLLLALIAICGRPDPCPTLCEHVPGGQEAVGWMEVLGFRCGLRWREGRGMPSHVVTCRVDDATTVTLEIEPPDGFQSAGAGEVAGRIREAITPAVGAAKAVLGKVKETRPDEIEVKFGVKASGEASWLAARAAVLEKIVGSASGRKQQEGHLGFLLAF